MKNFLRSLFFLPLFSFNNNLNNGRNSVNNGQNKIVPFDETGTFSSLVESFKSEISDGIVQTFQEKEEYDDENEEVECLFKMKPKHFNDKYDKYGYYLRIVSDDDSITTSSNTTTMIEDVDEEWMRKILFKSNFNPVIESSLLTKLYTVSVFESIHGRKAQLPWSPESFLTFLFVECRDLRLIRIMLRVCQGNVNILKDYFRVKDQVDSNDYYCDGSGDGLNVRNHLLLQFYVEMRQYDAISAKITLQLMGFTNLTNLKLFYASNDDPYINYLLFKLEGTQDDEELDWEDEIINSKYDSSDSYLKVYEYTYEPNIID